MLSETIAELERWLKLATSGTWCCPDYANDAITVSAMTDVGISAYSTIISFCPTHQTDGDGRNWESDGSVEANRQLCALFHNNARELLTAAKLSEARGKAVEALRRAYYVASTERHDRNHSPIALERIERESKAALAELDEAMEGKA